MLEGRLREDDAALAVSTSEIGIAAATAATATRKRCAYLNMLFDGCISDLIERRECLLFSVCSGVG